MQVKVTPLTAHLVRTGTLQTATGGEPVMPEHPIRVGSGLGALHHSHHQQSAARPNEGDGFPR